MFVIVYAESERGWGGETWYRGFDTKAEALAEIEDCNKDYNFDGPVPDYYILAFYEGEMAEAPS